MPLLRLTLSLLFGYSRWALGLHVNPVYTLGVEFVSGSFTNLTSRVERGNWGSTIVDMLEAPRPGMALFELHNGDGSLTPRNNTNLVPGKAVKLTATHGGSTYPLFFGRILDVAFSARLGARTTILECRDDWDRVSRLKYNTGLFINTKPASLFTTLMSQSRVQSFSADSITDTIPFAWYRDRDASNALHQLVRSGHYQILVDGNGTYRLRDRFWSFFNTSVATYSEADDTRISLSQDSIINRTKMTATPRRQFTDTTTLAFLSQVVEIASGQGFGFWVSFQDPFEPSEVTPVGSIVSPVASTDYYGATNSDGTGASLTSQLSLQLTSFAASAVASIYNSGPGTAYLTRFQVRGFPVRRLPDVSGQYDISSSQDQYGLRLLSVDDALIDNLTFMESLTKIITVERHRGRERHRFALSNEFPDCVRNSLGDVVSVVDNFTGYATQWQIRGSEHELSLTSGLRHTVTYEMETFDNFPFLVLDHATFGKLDNGRVLAV